MDRALPIVGTQGPAVAALVLTTAMWAAADEPRPSSCVIAADKQVPVKAGPGRTVYCGLDLGSRSAKLSVVSGLVWLDHSASSGSYGRKQFETFRQ